MYPASHNRGRIVAKNVPKTPHLSGKWQRKNVLHLHRQLKWRRLLPLERNWVYFGDSGSETWRWCPLHTWSAVTASSPNLPRVWRAGTCSRWAPQSPWDQKAENCHQASPAAFSTIRQISQPGSSLEISDVCREVEGIQDAEMQVSAPQVCAARVPGSGFFWAFLQEADKATDPIFVIYFFFFFNEY